MCQQCFAECTQVVVQLFCISSSEARDATFYESHHIFGYPAWREASYFKLGGS